MTERSTRRIGKVRIYGTLFAALACDKDMTQNRVDDASAAATNPQPAIIPSAAKVGDTVTGAGRLRWTAARVGERLRAAGFVLVDGGTVSQSFMSVAGTIYNLRDAIIQVYIYGDAIAVARDTDGLDSASVAPANMSINWLMPPSLVVDNNLAAIVLTRDDSMRRRIKAALTAEGDDIREP